MGTYAVMTGSEPKIEREEGEFFKRLSEEMKKGPDAALALINREISANSSAAIYFIRGNLNFQKGNLGAAQRDYRTSLDKFKNFMRAHKNLGMINLRQENFKQAAQDLGRAIELGDREARTYGLLGYCQLQVGNYLGAENAYRTALMLTPDNRDWSLGLAQALMLSEDYGAAISIMEPIALSSSNEAQYWLFLVNAYLQKDQPNTAAEILEFMRHGDLADVDNLILLGNIYTNEQDYTLALDVFEQVLEQEKQEVEPSVVLDASNLFVRYGAFDQAASLLQQIANEFGDILEQEEKLTLLRLNAQVANASGELEKSVAIHENILEIDPTDGVAMIELARYYADQEDYARAYLYLDRAEKLNDHQVGALRLRGQLLVREGRFRDALDPLERAVSLSTNENVNRRLEDYIAQVRRAAGIN
jgi:tetratricopeptide (TPR) repeat protein